MKLLRAAKAYFSNRRRYAQEVSRTVKTIAERVRAADENLILRLISEPSERKRAEMISEVTREHGAKTPSAIMRVARKRASRMASLSPKQHRKVARANDQLFGAAVALVEQRKRIGNASRINERAVERQRAQTKEWLAEIFGSSLNAYLYRSALVRSFRKTIRKVKKQHDIFKRNEAGRLVGPQGFAGLISRAARTIRGPSETDLERAAGRTLTRALEHIRQNPATFRETSQELKNNARKEMTRIIGNHIAWEIEKMTLREARSYLPLGRHEATRVYKLLKNMHKEYSSGAGQATPEREREVTGAHFDAISLLLGKRKTDNYFELRETVRNDFAREIFELTQQKLAQKLSEATPT